MSKKTNKPLVLLDVDGPLAEFTFGFLDELRKETGNYPGVTRELAKHITDYNITKSKFFEDVASCTMTTTKELEAGVWRRVNRYGFCSTLEVVPGAVEAVRELRGIADVEVVTSPLRTSPTWAHERMEWLWAHFGFQPDDVHFVSKKLRVPGDVLVDDRLDHVVSWSAACPGLPILWDAPYNQHTPSTMILIRAKTWKRVLIEVRSLVG